MQRIVAALAVLLFPIGLAAQQTNTLLRIHVADAAGAPVAATGTLVGGDTSRTFAVDDAGTATLQHLPPGTFELIVTRPGFSPATELVTIRSALPTDVRVRLQVAPVTAHVEVTAAPPLLAAHETGPAYAVGAQALHDLQAAIPGRTLIDAVNLQPGWLVEANGVLHPRGSEYQTLFVVDGVPMDENRSPAFAPDLDEGDAQSVRVLTGDIPAEYGRKLGGVVEVTTARDARRGLHGTATIGAGSFASALTTMSVSYGWPSGSLTVDATADRTNRYLDPPVAANLSNTGSVAGLSARYDAARPNGDRWYVAWREGTTAFSVPNDLAQQAAGQRQDRSGGESLADGGWTHVLSPRSLVELRASYDDLSATLRSNPESTPVIVGQQRGMRRGYAAAAVSIDAGRHSIKFGGDALYAPVREALQYTITDPAYFDPGTPASFTFADARPDRESSAFVQDTIRAGRLTVDAGLRWDAYHLVVADRAFSPRIGVGWFVPRLHTVVHAAYDRAFQTPAVENLLLASSPQVDAVDPQVLRLPARPSRGDFIQAGASTSIGATARIDASVYRRVFANFADDDVFQNTGIGFPISFRRAAIDGLDAKLTLPRWKTFSGFLSYSYLVGTADGPVSGGLFLGDNAQQALDARSFRITQDQRHTVRASVRDAFGSRAWAAAVVRYGSGLPVDIDPSELPSVADRYGAAVAGAVDTSSWRVRPNLAIDMAGGVQIWKRDDRSARLEARVDNVAGRFNVINVDSLFSGTAIASPRAATVRLSFAF